MVGNLKNKQANMDLTGNNDMFEEHYIHFLLIKSRKIFVVYV